MCFKHLTVQHGYFMPENHPVQLGNSIVIKHVFPMELFWMKHMQINLKTKYSSPHQAAKLQLFRH